MNRYKEVKYKWDEDSFITASKIAYEYSLKSSLKKYLGWLFIIIAQFALIVAIQKGTFGLLFISLIPLIYWYFLRWPIRAFIIKREFKKSGLKDKEFIVKISDKDITINNTKIPWSQITNIVLINNGYLLELTNQMLFLPKSAFSDKEAKEYFIKLAKSKSNYKSSD